MSQSMFQQNVEHEECVTNVINQPINVEEAINVISVNQRFSVKLLLSTLFKVFQQK